MGTKKGLLREGRPKAAVGILEQGRTDLIHTKITMGGKKKFRNGNASFDEDVVSPIRS